VTAEKAGQKASALFWPGSEAPIEEVRPSYWLPYGTNQKMTHDQRLATFFEWLDKPVPERPTFFTLYFSDVDSAGHDFGPGSPELRTAVQKVDITIGKLLAGLEQRRVIDRLNVIVVSDHGMVAVDPDRNIFIDDYIDLSKVRIAAWSPVLTLSAGNNTDEIIAKLSKAPHLKVYRKQDVPARLHYNDSDRIPPIVAIADPGWMITSHRRFAEKKKPTPGEHGYDNAVKDTWGIFIAHGPAFRSGMRIRPFENIHIYSAMCSILGLQPAPNDGSLAVLAPALRGTAPPRLQTIPQTSLPRTAPAADHRF
jgi:predicted AlkP superfamily pyrophosphatase or phosphodiesterase